MLVFGTGINKQLLNHFATQAILGKHAPYCPDQTPSRSIVGKGSKGHASQESPGSQND